MARHFRLRASFSSGIGVCLWILGFGNLFLLRLLADSEQCSAGNLGAKTKEKKNKTTCTSPLVCLERERERERERES